VEDKEMNQRSIQTQNQEFTEQEEIGGEEVVPTEAGIRHIKKGEDE
jgi:hypothetical protein